MNKVISERYHESYIEEILPNGLHVVIWHKPNYHKSFALMATPLGAFDIEQQDKEGKNYVFHPGLAHFLEHKMFEDEDHDVMNDFSRMGANVNAATTYDSTCYYFQTSGELDEPLNLLLDFTQSLNITDQSVEKEKGIIIQELSMYQQMSDFRLVRETFSSLYQRHPLRHDIGGTAQSVSEISKDELRLCYEMNYHPSAMSCIVVSGHEPERILETIRRNQQAKHFKPYKGSQRKPVNEPSTVAKKHTVFEMDVNKPKINIAFKLDGIQDPMERYRRELCLRFALDAVFSSVNDDYQRWLNQEIISDFYGYECDWGEDYGYLMVYTETDKKDEFLSLVKNNLVKMTHDALNEKLFEQLRRRYFGENIRELNDFEAIALTFMRCRFNGCNFFQVYDLIDSITLDDVYKAVRELEFHEYSVVECVPLS